MPRVLLIAAVLLAACVPDPQVPVPMPPAGTCGAAELQGLVGKLATVLEKMKLGRNVRIIRPGQAVTMDYSESRLNIEIDAAEVIVRLSCG